VKKLLFHEHQTHRLLNYTQHILLLHDSSDKWRNCHSM